MNDDKYLQAFEENHSQYTSLEDLERAKSFLLSTLIAKEEEARQAERERLVEEVLKIIDKNDPSTGRETNPRYWGKTLRADIISLLRDK